MKRLLLFILVLVLVVSTIGLSGCSFVKEGVTGERQDESGDGNMLEEEPAIPAAFNIIGDWSGVYAGSEYVDLRFTADGKCELQTGIYASDMFGPRYYGEYRWGGEGGKDIILDLYKGVSREVDFGEGNIIDEWPDGGREAATTALNMTFRVFAGSMKPIALKTDMGGIDTDGYPVIQKGAFMILHSYVEGGTEEDTFRFGSPPYDDTEGKTLMPSIPDSFTDRAERFYTTAELNVRCGPDTSYGTYGTVPIGTPVDKIAYMLSGHDDWAFVLLKDGGGWVNTGYLADSPPEQVQKGE